LDLTPRRKEEEKLTRSCAYVNPVGTGSRRSADAQERIPTGNKW